MINTAAHHLRFTDFLDHYTHATTKEQEAVVILEAFRQTKEECKKEMSEEIKFAD